jgi:hypothetical protein
MIRSILTIDQTPCRASYGLLSQKDFLADTVSRQRANVLRNIGEIASHGERLLHMENKANWIEEMAAERDDTPLAVALVSIDRPVINYRQLTSPQVDIFI